MARFRLALLAVIALSRCSCPAGDADAGVDGGIDAGVDAGRADGGLYALWLDEGPFDAGPDSPNALVLVPPELDLTPPLELAVFLHGYFTCPARVLASPSTQVACSDGGTGGPGFGLAEEFLDAGRHAVLVVPDFLNDASGNPGRLALDGGFNAMVTEVLLRMQPVLGPLTLNDLGRVSVAAERGGYAAASEVVSRGELPVDDLYLLDALYAQRLVFEQWLSSDLTRHRFASTYSVSGGTLLNNLAMLADVTAWDAGTVLSDPNPSGTVTDDQLRAQFIFKASGDALHGWLSRLWRTAP